MITFDAIEQQVRDFLSFAKEKIQRARAGSCVKANREIITIEQTKADCYAQFLVYLKELRTYSQLQKQARLPKSKTIAFLQNQLVSEADAHFSPEERAEANKHIQVAIDSLAALDEIDTAFELVRVGADGLSPQARAAVNAAWVKVRDITDRMNGRKLKDCVVGV